MTEGTEPEQGLHEGLLRRAVVVRGVVQGVGFRPFVYRLALEEGLAGLIGNDSNIAVFWRSPQHGTARLAPKRGISNSKLKKLGTNRNDYM